MTAADLRYMELEAAIAEVMTNKPFNLVHDERQIRKMMQLKESLDQRMGCVIGGCTVDHSIPVLCWVNMA
jgi:dynein heavy chain 2